MIRSAPGSLGRRATSSAWSATFARSAPRSRRWSAWPSASWWRAPLAQLWPAAAAVPRGVAAAAGRGPARRRPARRSGLAGAAADPDVREPRGRRGASPIEDMVRAIRLPHGRFGEPAVYVGTVRDAGGPPVSGRARDRTRRGAFAVLAAGGSRRSRRAAREAARPGADGAADRAERRRRPVDRGAPRARRGHPQRGARVALSLPRLDAERSMREPSSVILEAAAALGRPDAVTARARAGDPRRGRARARCLPPGPAGALELRRRMPLGEAAWQRAWRSAPSARRRTGDGAGAIDLDRLAALRAQGGAGPARRHPRPDRRRGNCPGAHARAAHLGLGAARSAPVPAPLPARQPARPGRPRLRAEPARHRPARLRGARPPGGAGVLPGARRRFCARDSASRPGARRPTRSSSASSRNSSSSIRSRAGGARTGSASACAAMSTSCCRTTGSTRAAASWPRAHLRPPDAARAAARRPLALRAWPDRPHRRRRQA